jgi:hypothetical protein
VTCFSRKLNSIDESDQEGRIRARVGLCEFLMVRSVWGGRFRSCSMGRSTCILFVCFYLARDDVMGIEKVRKLAN